MEGNVARCRVQLFCFATIGVLISFAASCAEIGVTLEWDPNPESNVAGYNAYVGTQSGHYERIIDAGTNTVVRISPLDPGVTYCFAVTAYTADHLESPFSDEIVYTVGIDGTNAMLKPLTITVTKLNLPVTISFSVKPGRHYLVQATTDFLTWQTLEDFFFETSAAVLWDDPESSAHSSRFYRVVAVMP
jgi:hypothetical protein